MCVKLIPIGADDHDFPVLSPALSSINIRKTEGLAFQNYVDDAIHVAQLKNIQDLAQYQHKVRTMVCGLTQYVQNKGVV